MTEIDDVVWGWEFGHTSKWGIQKSYDLAEAEFNAELTRQEISAGRSSGDLKYHGKVVCRKVAHYEGEWEDYA